MPVWLMRLSQQHVCPLRQTEEAVCHCLMTCLERVCLNTALMKFLTILTECRALLQTAKMNKYICQSCFKSCFHVAIFSYIQGDNTANTPRFTCYVVLNTLGISRIYTQTGLIEVRFESVKAASVNMASGHCAV
jgi:hypothetical protein